MKKIIETIKNNKIFCIVFCISFILHVLATINLGINYSINSDDIRYIESGITLFETGTLTIYGTETAQIMPLLSMFIALIYSVVQSKTILIIILKIGYLIFSLLSLIYLYKTIKLFANKNIAAFTSALLLTLDFIWMDNIILTETPFIMFFIILVYNSLRLASTLNIKNYVMIIISYLACLYLRPAIILYPIFLFIYLLIKKYDFKILVKQTVIGFGIVVLCLIPWWIRNYKLFNDFIPLTNGAGNPMYLGTYQGYNYPLDEELDYTVIEKDMSQEMKAYLNGSKYDDPHMLNYYALKKDSMIAKYRIEKWWQKDKLAFLVSYFCYKPAIMLISSFYWENLFGIPRIVNIIIHAIELLVCFIASIIIIKDKKYSKELLLLAMVYFYLLFGSAMAFAFSRYAMPTYFLRFIVIGIGINIIYQKYQKKKEMKVG